MNIICKTLLPVIFLLVLSSSALYRGECGTLEIQSDPYDNLNLYWGDIHTHDAYSQDAAVQGTDDTPDMALLYAKQMGLDFAAVTNHAEIFYPMPQWTKIKMKERWLETVAWCQDPAYNDNFVAFPGFEYTNCEPQDTGGHGHKCVIFKDPAHVIEHPVPYNDDLCPTPVELWQKLDESPAAGQYITVPHHPAKGEVVELNQAYYMGTDWNENYVNAARQPLVETYSVHGCSESPVCEEKVEDFNARATVESALMMWLNPQDGGLLHNPAYKLGIIGSTDNHLAHPGAVAELDENVNLREGPFTGGLVAVWAANKNREDIWRALTNKSVYATSGARIGLEFYAETGTAREPVLMGQTLKYSGEEPPAIKLHVKAVSDKNTEGDPVGIKSIQIFRNNQIIKTFENVANDAQGRVEVVFEDNDASTAGEWFYYRVKVYQNDTPTVSYDPNNDDNWDEGPHLPNERAWSSPIWVEPFRVNLEINASASMTSSKAVTLKLAFTGDQSREAGVQMRFSNDGSAWSAWEPLGTQKSWTLSAGEGNKEVCVEVRDDSGQVATAADSIVLDTVHPAITGTDPRDGAEGVPTGKTIIVYFDQEIKEGGSFQEITLQEEGAGPVPFSTGISGNTVTLAPSAKLCCGKHYVVALPQDAVEDLAGNSVSGTNSFDFYTPKGDMNGDCRLNILDLLWIAECSGTKAGDPAWTTAGKADVNNDQAVNILDLLIASQYLGN